jgi:hypothetical protein
MFEGTLPDFERDTLKKTTKSLGQLVFWLHSELHALHIQVYSDSLILGLLNDIFNAANLPCVETEWIQPKLSQPVSLWPNLLLQPNTCLHLSSSLFSLSFETKFLCAFMSHTQILFTTRKDYHLISPFNKYRFTIYNKIWQILMTKQQKLSYFRMCCMCSLIFLNPEV